MESSCANPQNSATIKLPEIWNQPTERHLQRAKSVFAEAAAKWLLGHEPFWAKLNPAYAPYGEYDQLMRLEEWYGR